MNIADRLSDGSLPPLRYRGVLRSASATELTITACETLAVPQTAEPSHPENASYTKLQRRAPCGVIPLRAVKTREHQEPYQRQCSGVRLGNCHHGERRNHVAGSVRSRDIEVGGGEFAVSIPIASPPCRVVN